MSETADERGTGKLTAEEREAMKERAREARAEAKRGKGLAAAAADLADVLTKISEMPEPDRAMATRLHELITAAAPELAPKTWYGMPAYAKDGKTICFFQNASKFKVRYNTLGFNEHAALDEGTMWPTSFALIELNDATEARITELVRRAVSA